MPQTRTEGIHAVPGGHVVRAGANVPSLVAATDSSTLCVGAYTTVKGPLRHQGTLVLSRGCVTWGGIDGGVQVIIGADCTIEGSIRCQGNVVVQAGSTVNGRIIAGNDVRLLGECTVQDVICDGDLYIAGSPATGQLQPAGRIQTVPF